MNLKQSETNLELEEQQQVNEDQNLPITGA